MPPNTWILGRSPGWTLLRAAVIGLAIFLASRTLLVPLRATGVSMMPTYEEGQLLLVNRLAYVRQPPARGDIVAVRLGAGEAALVKRVIGLPGERVRIEAGTVVIDDVPLVEPYVRYHIPWNVPELVVSDNELFVVGDNRSMPARLHDFGLVHRRRVMGRLVN
jgi:signal peptidase I